MTAKAILILVTGVFAATAATATEQETATYDPVEAFSPEQIAMIKAAYSEAPDEDE